MRFRFVLPLLASVSLLTACRERKVTSYRVPHEAPEPLPPILTGEVPMSAAGSGSMASTPVPTAEGNALTWIAPADWKEKPRSAIRKGSYAVPGPDGAEADLSITAFPGDVGGELANLNRWRGQIDLPPITEADVPAAVTRQSHDGLDLVIVDFSNPKAEKAQRILGALVAHDGATWFFKLMGSDAVVGAQKDAFMKFLATVKPAAAAAQP